MKIEKVTFKNLNSLAGNWEIDFTNQEYVNNGIFAITGATGAGKTTIFDAICLAIYAKTPRLERINRDNNEIISRNTGECSSEVIFSVNNKRYRVHWSQNRARKKFDGSLQNAKHELVEITGNNNKIIANTLTETPKKIQDITGMSFNQFSRSVMLAQGNFATFLKANDSEKAEILEQITGSEIYSEISKLVHEINREKKSELDSKKEAIGNVTVLSDEEKRNILNEQKSLIESNNKDQEKISLIENKIKYLIGIANLNDELAKTQKRIDENNAEQKEFEENKIKLDNARKAETLRPDYVILKSKVEEFEKKKNELNDATKKLPEITKQKEDIDEKKIQCEKEIEMAKEEWGKTSQTIVQVRQLDTQYNEKLNPLREQEENLKKIKINIDKNKKEISIAKDKLNNINSQRKDFNNFLKENGKLERLSTELTGIEERLKTLSNQQDEIKELSKEISQNELNINKSKEEVEKFNTKIEEKEKAEKEIIKRLNSLNDELEKFLGDGSLKKLRKTKDKKLKEIAEVAKITSLQDERKKLQDKKPCPLCGSLEHPYAMGNIPQPSTLEEEIEQISAQINQIEILEKKILGTKEQKNTIQKEKQEILQKIELLKQDVKTKEKLLNEKNKKKNKTIGIVEQTKTNLLTALKDYNVGSTEIENPDSLLKHLKKQVKEWEEKSKQVESLNTEKGKFESQINTLEPVVKAAELNLKTLTEKLESLTSEINSLLKERKDLFGDKNPDTEEKNFKDTSDSLNNNKKKIDEKFNDIKNQLNILNSNIKRLEKEIENNNKEIENSQIAFNKKLTKNDFTDLQNYENALMEKESFSELEKQEKELETTAKQLEALQNNQSRKWKIEKEKKKTDESKEQLEEQKKSLGELLTENLKRVGEINNQLNSDKAAQEKLKVKLEEIELLKKEADKWGKLHDLIGSNDGKKFRNFAQGLTFEIMINKANSQLKMMSERYLLVRDKEKQLSLNVIDSYQGGNTRSTKNLSGGESFIISLALALGISNMASKNNSIDSLFLDEGFATLDSEALETALKTLASLQQTGKLIGIISHVTALKERIGTQIIVEKLTGGNSKITGPGVRNI